MSYSPFKRYPKSAMAKALTAKQKSKLTPEHQQAISSALPSGELKAKKSTKSAHGQMNDAAYEYEQDKKILSKKKLSKNSINVADTDYKGNKGFVNAPYKDPQGMGPRANRSDKKYHGFKKPALQKKGCKKY